LRKLWANIKLGQRKALTAEKQARLATGGGPEHSVAQTDPEVLAIASHLMINAPVTFTSNMSDTVAASKFL